MDRAPFIVLEGLDGVGKTSAAALLAKRLGAKLLNTPPPEYHATGENLIQDFRKDSYFLYMLSAAARTSECVASHRLGSSIVADRYYLSALAYRYGTHTDATSAPFSFEEPDLTILLVANEEIRRARLRARGRTLSLTEALLETQAIRERVSEFYRARIPCVLDTSHLSPPEVTEQLSIIASVRGLIP